MMVPRYPAPYTPICMGRFPSLRRKLPGARHSASASNPVSYVRSAGAARNAPSYMYFREWKITSRVQVTVSGHQSHEDSGGRLQRALRGNAGQGDGFDIYPGIIFGFADEG